MIVKSGDGPDIYPVHFPRYPVNRVIFSYPVSSNDVNSTNLSGYEERSRVLYMIRYFCPLKFVGKERHKIAFKIEYKEKISQRLKKSEKLSEYIHCNYVLEPKLEEKILHHLRKI